MTREAVIVAASRTAVGKAKKGSTRNWRSDEMAAAVIAEVMRQAGGLDPQEIDDVIIGCAMPEGAQGLNFARTIALRAGLPVDVPGMTVNRFCSSGLQTIAMAAERIIANGADAIIAGGRSDEISATGNDDIVQYATPFLLLRFLGFLTCVEFFSR